MIRTQIQNQNQISNLGWFYPQTCWPFDLPYLLISILRERCTRLAGLVLHIYEILPCSWSFPFVNNEALRHFNLQLSRGGQPWCELRPHVLPTVLRLFYLRDITYPWNLYPWHDWGQILYYTTYSSFSKHAPTSTQLTLRNYTLFCARWDYVWMFCD